MDASTISYRTIQRDLERAAKFLGTLSRSPQVWRVMVTAAGYSQAVHDAGWGRYLAVMGYRPPAPSADEHPSQQNEAIAQLDEFDGPAFARAKAAWARPFPAQSERVFRGLSAAEGAGAVASVQTFLTRVAELRGGSPEDQAAAALLAERKILTPEVQAQLEGWIAAARTGAPPPDELPGGLMQDPTYLEQAQALHDFLQDWRTQARNVINRRDYLIQLGLASRRPSSSGTIEVVDEVDDEEEPEAA